MNQNKVHSQGRVPFSWENKPGISKVRNQDYCPVSEVVHFMQKLPPPPCPQPESARNSFHDIQIPLPPCPFQPPPRSSSRKGLRKLEDDDPFLAAYKEITKSTKKGKLPKRDSIGFGFNKGMLSFSCKHSCSVRNDNFVRVSQLPRERGSKIEVTNETTGIPELFLRIS